MSLHHGSSAARPANWDRLKLVYPGSDRPARCTPHDRCHRRTEILARLVGFKSLRAGEPLVQAAASELRNRFTYWRRSYDAIPVTRTELKHKIRARRIAIGLLMGLVLIAPAVTFLAITSSSGTPPSALFTCAVIGLTLSVFLGVWLEPEPRAQRCANALVGRWCCDCRYDLLGSPDAIEPALLEGLRVGPQRCPECGCAWPLVPAPGAVYDPPS